MERLMTVRECAAALNLRPWAVYQKIKAGVIPGVRIGRMLRIRPEQLHALIESSTTLTSVTPSAGPAKNGPATPHGA